MNYSNNAYSVLNGGISASDTAITLATGTGERFPASNFNVTLIGYDGLGNETLWEICLCSSRSGDVLTVSRGQEGTSAAAWANGARIENRITAGTMAALEPTITPGTNAQYWRGNKTWRDFFTDVRAATLTGLSTATNAVVAAADTVLVAIGKLQAQITGHKGATSNAHPASAIDLANPAVHLPGSLTAGTVQQRMEEIFNSQASVATNLANHRSEAYTQHPASTISNTPAGNITATTVQGALNQLDVEKMSRAQTVYSNGSGNLNDAPLGAFSGYYALSGAGTNYPAPSLPVAWWNVLTFGWETRRTQIAQQAFNSRPGQFWFRHLHDTNWSPWYRLPATTAETGFLVQDGGALGYGVGAGGTASQPGQNGGSQLKTNSITLNKPSGTLLLGNDSLQSGASIEFQFNNSLLTSSDGLILNPDGFVGYSAEVAYNNTETQKVIRLTNKGATRSDAVSIRFAIFKGSAV